MEWTVSGGGKFPVTWKCSNFSLALGRNIVKEMQALDGRLDFKGDFEVFSNTDTVQK